MAGARTSRTVRAALALVALVVIGWLAVGLRSAVPETRAKEALTHRPLTSADRARVLSLLHDARTLNPDTRPRVTEGALLLISRKPRQATAVLRGVVAAEPRNAPAWSLLATAYRAYDPARSAAALARFRQLKPAVGR